ASLAGSWVEAEDLLRVVPLPVGAEVGQRDAQAVGADREEFVIVRLNAAGRTELPEPPPVGAHEEKALLRQPPDSWERKPPAGHLEDHPCAIRQHRDALKVEAEALCRTAAAGLAIPTTQPRRIRLRGARVQFLHRDRIAVPAPDEKLLLQRGPSQWVGRTLGHHVGEGANRCAGGRTGAPCGAGRPA